MGCGGRLTADYGIGLVTCNGRFNEERGVYMKCFFKAPLANITDRIPWRNTAPSAGNIFIYTYNFCLVLPFFYISMHIHQMYKTNNNTIIQ